MIDCIKVGRGNHTVTIPLPASRDERIKLGNVVKSKRLFPDSRSFQKAKARGAAAVEAARHA